MNNADQPALMEGDRTIEVTEHQLHFILTEWRGMVAGKKENGKCRVYLMMRGGRTEKEIRSYLQQLETTKP